jgi:hypothetical protein
MYPYQMLVEYIILTELRDITVVSNDSCVDGAFFILTYIMKVWVTRSSIPDSGIQFFMSVLQML